MSNLNKKFDRINVPKFVTKTLVWSREVSNEFNIKQSALKFLCKIGLCMLLSVKLCMYAMALATSFAIFRYNRQTQADWSKWEPCSQTSKFPFLTWGWTVARWSCVTTPINSRIAGCLRELHKYVKVKTTRGLLCRSYLNKFTRFWKSSLFCPVW